MPYITQTDREALRQDRRVPRNAGELNYRITQEADRFLHAHGLRYENINTVIGVLEAVKLELYRRVAAAYEDEKILENGDVYTVRSKVP